MTDADFNLQRCAAIIVRHINVDDAMLDNLTHKESIMTRVDQFRANYTIEILDKKYPDANVADTVNNDMASDFSWKDDDKDSAYLGCLAAQNANPVFLKAFYAVFN